MPELEVLNQTHPAPKELAVEMRRLIGVLRQGWRLIAISAVVCLTLAGLYVAAAKRVYQATTRLLVLQQGGRPLNMANSDPNRIMEGTDDYIPTHSMIVCSPMVVKQAIEKVGLEHLPTLLAAKRADKDPVEEAISTSKSRVPIVWPRSSASITRLVTGWRPTDWSRPSLPAISNSWGIRSRRTAAR